MKKSKWWLIEGVFWVGSAIYSFNCISNGQNVMLLPLFIFALSLCGLIFFFFWFFKNLGATHKDVRIAFLVFGIVFNIILFLVFSNKLVEQDTLNKFSTARVEWFVAFVSVMGIVGAVWAILAKIEASQAFKAAVNAHRAIAGIVDFNELLIDGGKKAEVPMLPGLVKSAEEELIMVLGVPAVGFFRKEMREEALTFCFQLANKLRELSSNNNVLKIVLLYFRRDKLLELIRDAKSDISEQDAKAFNTAMDYFDKAVEKIHAQMPLKFRYKQYTFDPGLRFIISTSKIHGKMYEKMALVWVVSNFMDDTPTNFQAAGFTTRDDNIIKNLTILAEDYLKRLP